MLLDKQFIAEIDAMDEDMAERIFWEHRWFPDGIPRCPKCGSFGYTRITTRRRLDCVECDHEYTAKSGTIFASSTLSFRQLLKAVCLADEDNLTRKRVRDVVGVSESGASPLLQRIRVIRVTGGVVAKDLPYGKKR